ncbi:hypothetical protein BT63DRAFT_420113 [Microthyrium microscopicum]|uniref:PLD phosphodiesterase domain-containing protein n=1 Tax=Microthyrium microscopicum TaxID=703497 RepID=A0A6A6USV9_9PEZI|nr:hypothetical protein BT63DRAFT_420113 [Microthyrium microscopicum]
MAHLFSRGLPDRLHTPSDALRPTPGNPWDLEHLWILRLRKQAASFSKDSPNYYAHDLEGLQSTARVHAFMTGPGVAIFEQLQASIESAEKELILITCFWAKSPSLELLAQSLQRLSDKTQKSGRPPVKVFIGFSSLSLLQKLFQTSSLGGKLYSSTEWSSELDLPTAARLPGLDITIKSVFVKPFSVMHPKFVIVDRKLAWLPSCNVSWEEWFEGAIVTSGPIVDHFVELWKDFWLQGQAPWPEIETSTAPGFAFTTSISLLATNSPNWDQGEDVEATFLPSPHHASALCLPFWPNTAYQDPPPTPLNAFLQSQIQLAQKSIYIQTPNVTSFTVLHELMSALQNGVNVSITTSARLMILEQLVTAGTTTSRCVNWLTKQHKRLLALPQDPESGTPVGRLQIWYFKKREDQISGEPSQSHIKCTIFDDAIVVLGSQNMDRASWFTSQELGVAFQSKKVVEMVKATLEKGMEGRRSLVYDSGDKN